MTQITIDGHLEHITYHNKENYYTVARFRIDKTENLITVVGYLPDPNLGESLKITGNWESHHRYGQQFKIEYYEIILPKTQDNISAYLSSGIIKGIGPQMAKRMVRFFEDQTLDIIEKHPERLLEIPGIGSQKAAQITASWKIHHALRQLIVFLQEHKIPPSFSAKILRAYDNDAIPILQQQPYRITKDVPGFTFSMADTLAQNMGILKDDPQRILGGMTYIMEQFASDGHMFMYEHQFIERCVKLLDIDPDQMVNGIDELVDSGKIIRDTVLNDSPISAIYLKEYHETEIGIANRLKALLSVPIVLPEITMQQLVDEVLRRMAIQLSSEQIDVLKGIFSHRVAIITGGPGTGKTTLIRTITTIFSLMGKEVLLAAPTGRAARRLSEVTRRKAYTIHKLLGFDFTTGYFFKNQDDPLETDVIVVDEVSMVDAFLMLHLLKAVPMTSRIILVGDVFQLPSVGPGNVLSDMIQSGAIVTYELNTIYRQAQESPIVMNAHRVRKGEYPDLTDHTASSGLSEFYFIRQHHPEHVVDTILKLCSDNIPRQYGFDRIEDIQVLSPMHKGEVGTINLNQVLQQTLNPSQVKAKYENGVFKLGDKVIHLKNNYQKDVFNGDIGIIRAIDNAENTLSVDYDGRIVDYAFSELDELSLAYTITVHKSQGSEYPAIIVPIMTQHYALLQRNLIYTAMTRGKNLVIFIGTQQALEIAIKNNKPFQRLTGLARRIETTSLPEIVSDTD